MAEQLFCKQLAVSSNLTVGSRGRCQSGQLELAVNQSGFALRRFESFPAHLDTDTLPERRCQRDYLRIAHVAQSVEHILGKNEVISSNLIVGSRFPCREQFGKVSPAFCVL